MEKVNNNSRFSEVTLDDPVSGSVGCKGGNTLSTLRGRQETPANGGQTSFLPSKYQKTDSSNGTTGLSAGGTTAALTQILEMLKEIVGMLEKLTGSAPTKPAEKPEGTENSGETKTENQIFSQILSLLQDIIGLLEEKVDKKNAGGNSNQAEPPETSKTENVQPQQNNDNTSQLLGQILELLQQLLALLENKLGVENKSASPEEGIAFEKTLQKLKEDLEKLSTPIEAEKKADGTEKNEPTDASAPLNEDTLIKNILGILSQLVELLQNMKGVDKGTTQ